MASLAPYVLAAACGLLILLAHYRFNSLNPTIRPATIYRSAWFFPALLLIPLIILTSLQIHGSSIGFYHSLLYGEQSEDPDLILGNPRQIRSDEWLVNTQLTIAQDKVAYSQINQNIGNGQDNSVIIDTPYADWSAAFRPHNLGFFVLSFDNAFALRWWSIAYLLIVSVYFVCLFFLPKKRLLAALIALGFYFSPFIQWWYLSGTLNTISFALIGMLGSIVLLRADTRSKQALYIGLVYYAATSFALTLYPPFQIPVAIVVATITVAYLVINRTTINRLWHKLGLLALALVMSLSTISLFAVQRSDVIETIRNTVYPGRRSEISGQFDVTHFLSNHLSAPLQFTGRAANYALPDIGATNQSAVSNFLLLSPYLLLPSVFLLYASRKKGQSSTRLLLAVVIGLSLFFAVRLFIPGLEGVYNIFLLDQVPAKRLLIGVGVLSLLHLIIFIKARNSTRSKHKMKKYAAIYSIGVFLVQLAISLHVSRTYPGFVGWEIAALLAIPIPLLIYLLLRGKQTFAITIFLGFSIVSSGVVHPLYVGTEVITESTLSQEVRRVGASNPDAAWAAEEFYFENFALLNDHRSLSGLYSYPQYSIFESDISANPDDYNRYAHVNFVFDKNPGDIDTEVELVGRDNLVIKTEPCSKFIKVNNVRFILTTAEINDSCTTLESEVVYPRSKFYIYSLKF